MGNVVKKRVHNEGASPISEFVSRAQAGDSSAYTDLIEATQSRLFRFCLTLTGDRVLSEDLCQDAYIKVLARIGSLEKPGAFMDWLFRITRNLYLDHIRSGQARETELDEAAMESRDPRSADLAEVMSIHRALAQIEPEDRWLLLLVDLEERSYQEAAEALGVSEDSVRSRLFRLRKQFVEQWKKT